MSFSVSLLDLSLILKFVYAAGVVVELSCRTSTVAVGTEEAAVLVDRKILFVMLPLVKYLIRLAGFYSFPAHYYFCYLYEEKCSRHFPSFVIPN